LTRAEWSLAMLVAAVSMTRAVVTGSTCVNTWKCVRAPSTITLDAKLDDWSEVEGIATELRSIVAKTYQDGNATLKCLYDDTNIYFALEIPGLYQFNATNYHQCQVRCIFLLCCQTMTMLGVSMIMTVYLLMLEKNDIFSLQHYTMKYITKLTWYPPTE